MDAEDGMDAEDKMDAEDEMWKTCPFKSMPHSLGQWLSAPRLPFLKRFTCDCVLEPMTVPFFMDSGATAHISHASSDSYHIQPIASKPVKGIGGSVIQAIGVGEMRMHVADAIDSTDAFSGTTLSLSHLLLQGAYAPLTSALYHDLPTLVIAGITFFDPLAMCQLLGALRASPSLVKLKFGRVEFMDRPADLHSLLPLPGGVEYGYSGD
ncbi:hypothetical protein BOTBODRAFT_402517 [Botryobasidium botryosum FD-172 SS1]|uniref:Uncharacterized protein n=1 Tax=Botryobasidium botryosum (strain FD-172 SS1) TaxID=930990 RepID=A0A067MND5_BOTB1|nr:hypothetical protein BOTBODRAFT_402517 [Botryobasidium botryosum FD-172 SS1]